MGSSVKAILVVLFITLSAGNASATEIGLKAGTLGGPLFSVVCMKDISDKLSADLTVGGFPGIILRAETNLKKYTGIHEIYGLARKEMSPVLLHAAAFDPAITRIALMNFRCCQRRYREAERKMGYLLAGWVGLYRVLSREGRWP